VSVPAGTIDRTFVVALATFRGAFAGLRGIAFLFAAVLFPLLLLLIQAAAFTGLDLLGTSESLLSALFLPVILLLVCLVLGVGAFRGELEDDTLVYPLNRTLPRRALAAGKYLGTAAAALCYLLPSTLVGTALAAALGTGPTMASPGLYEAVLLLPAMAILAYTAIFVLLGLLTRYALVIGLLYGFLWETFVSLIPGPIRELTVIYYLRAVGSNLVPSGTLGAGVAPLAPAYGLLGALGMAIGSIVVCALILRFTEIRPAAAPS
jgi:ABC-2 type transport system permease protein